jgi:alkaline phosphatase
MSTSIFRPKTPYLRTGLAALAATLITQIAGAQSPAVQGPESVEDWWNAGQRFIDANRRLQRNTRKAENVILFIGDGMGISTITAARILEGQLRGLNGEENSLFFEKLPYVALSKTYSWDQQTSDSAPTMTAMVTGYKAREGMLSVNHLTPRFERNAEVIAANSLETILELAARNGKVTGIVSTARLTHATPAANYAHTAVRDWESDAEIRAFEAANSLGPVEHPVKDIAAQLIDASPEVLRSLKVALGGGRSYFEPNTKVDAEYGGSSVGRRRDGRDLPAEWVETRGGSRRAAYVWNQKQFDAIDPNRIEYLLGLFEPSHMQFEYDRVAKDDVTPSIAGDLGGEPSLTEMTAKAIRMLERSRRGFYLQIEGGRIDHAHHAGNAFRALTEAIEFARAVKKAYEMTDPDDTLIIVTADHSHVFTISGYPSRGNPILGKVKSVPQRDGDPLVEDKDLLGLPYTTLSYANGPGNTGTSRLPNGNILQEAGVKTYPHIPPSYDNDAKRPDLTDMDTTRSDFMQEATVPLNSETHAGEDVAIFASGPLAHYVHGVMEQNWIYHVMRAAFDFHRFSDRSD